MPYEQSFDEQWVSIMVFNNATFNNISVISWRSVSLAEETEYPSKITDLSQVTETLSHNVGSSTLRHERNSNSQL